VSSTAHYVCPRCGKPIWDIQAKRRGSKLYYYAVHREVLPDGRVKFSYCYLGPQLYTYVSKLQEDLGLELKSPLQEVVEGRPRIIDYIEGIAKTVEDKMAKSQVSAYTAQQLADRLQELANKLRQYAQQRAVEEAKARGDTQ